MEKRWDEQNLREAAGLVSKKKKASGMKDSGVATAT